MAASQSTRNDPITAFCFRVNIEHVAGLSLGEAYFKSVSGLKGEIEVVDYKEGGNNYSPRRLVGPTKWPNIVMARGFTVAKTPLVDWFNEWLNDAPGTELKRVNGFIEALDSKLSPVCKWRFQNGWPCKWEGPDFDAGKQEVAIEKLEIAHEGLTFEKAKKS